MNLRRTGRRRTASGRSLLRCDRRGRRARPGIARDQCGATTVEFALLLAAIAIPLYGVFRVAFDILVANYQMMTFLNGWPFP